MSPSRRLRALAFLALVLLFAPSAVRAAAYNACADGGRQRPDEGGIGGTGARPAAPDDDSGIGGTGARPAAPADDSGVGGTGVEARGDGIGGTGIQARGDDGIGGTGMQASGDTGVIGTITGFASICVGEVEIHYDAKTPVQIDGQPAAAGDLAVGQVVEVVASGDGSELKAREIAVHHIVSGPVTSVDAEHSEVTVIGQRVQVQGAELAGEGDAAAASSLTPGTFVQVSGMRRGDGTIVATRLARSEARELVQLTGPLAESASSLSIAGTEVRITSAARPAAGEEVRIVGRWSGDAIRAESVESLPRIPFDGRVARLEIEGYARESVNGQLMVGAYPIEMQAASVDLRQSLTSDERVRVEGRLHDRHLVVDRVDVMPGPPDRPEKPEKDGHGFKDGDPRQRGHMGGPPPFDQGGSGPPDHPPMQDGGMNDGGMMPPPRPDSFGGGQPGPPDRPGQPDRPPPPPDRPDVPRFDRPPRPDRPDLPDRPAPPDRPDIPDRPAPPDRPEPPPPRPERPQRFERPPLPRP